MKKISDLHSNKPISRQRKWQLRHMERGLCIRCNEPAESGGLCFKHKSERRVAKVIVEQPTKTEATAAESEPIYTEDYPTP